MKRYLIAFVTVVILNPFLLHFTYWIFGEHYQFRFSDFVSGVFVAIAGCYAAYLYPSKKKKSK